MAGAEGPLAAMSAVGGPLTAWRRGRMLGRAVAPYRLVRSAPGPAGWHEGQQRLHPYRRLASELQARSGRWRVGADFAARLEKVAPGLRAGDALAMWLLGLVVLCGAGGVVAGALGLALALLLGSAVPVAVLHVAEDRRSQRFAAQLPGLLQATAAGLRAGFSLLQTLTSVSRQLDQPAAGELQRVLGEVQLGHSLEESLEECARRNGNRDFTETVAAVRIQQETGGNLAGLFDVLAETVLGRASLRREVRALTAETRISAYVLGALPLILGVLIAVVDPAYMSVLFHTRTGELMVLVAVVLQLLGFALLFRLSRADG